MARSLELPAWSDRRAIHWRLVWGVVVLQVALQLGWIVYSAYQPILLLRFGYAALLTPFALLPALVGLLSEPISGALSDRCSTAARGRLLPITVTVSVAGLIFLATAGLLHGRPVWISAALPGLMLAWVLAVQATSSPNLAQLNEAVSLRSLPRAVALLTLSQGLIGACSGSLARGALRLGPSFSFLLGGSVLGLGLIVLRGAGSGPQPTPAVQRPATPPFLPAPALLSTSALLLVVAVAVGGQIHLLLDLLPRLPVSSTAALPAVGPASVVLLCSALGAPLAGRAVGRWGRLPSLAAGITLLAVALAGSLALPRPCDPLLLPLLGLIHSLLATSLMATSLAALSPGGSGLGAGLALAGSSLAGGLSLLRFGSSGPVQRPELLLLLLLTTAAALGGCLVLERLRRHHRSGTDTVAAVS